MTSELNGFSDSIIGQISEIGIEILTDKNNDDYENFVARAIYEISKQSSKEYKQVNRNK